MTDESCNLKKEVKQLKSDLEDSKKKYDNLVEFGEDLKAQVERKIEVYTCFFLFIYLFFFV